MEPNLRYYEKGDENMAQLFKGEIWLGKYSHPCGMVARVTQLAAEIDLEKNEKIAKLQP